MGTVKPKRQSNIRVATHKIRPDFASPAQTSTLRELIREQGEAAYWLVLDTALSSEERPPYSLLTAAQAGAMIEAMGGQQPTGEDHVEAKD